MKLTSPVVCSIAQWRDVYEIVKHCHENYCRDSGRKLFLASFSMSGNWAACALAFESDEMRKLVSAATIMCPPLKSIIAFDHFKQVWDGFINRWLAAKFKRNYVDPNYEFLRRSLKERINFDFADFINKADLTDS